ncbi:MAG: sulfatase-like hydrolase/transferase [Planctomycetota bacterium]
MNDWTPLSVQATPPRYGRSRSALIVAAILLVGEGVGAATQPNFVIFLADDLGYSDLGCYGGEIHTPRLDALAAGGERYSAFRASPMCTTSRVALMSGMPYHAAGEGSYRRAIPLPALLKRSGYRTMMVGKWHAGEPNPMSAELFDRSFGFLGGMTDSFTGGEDWFLDRESFGSFSPGFYSTRAFARRAATMIEEAVSLDAPFFMYVAFNAPHHPCQAPRATVERYLGKYRGGYEAIAQQRHERQIAMGLVDPQWPRAEPGPEVRRWQELPAQRRVIEDARMAAYAAAVEEVDHATGTVLDALKAAGVDDNTFVAFLSDNGGDYSNGAPESDAAQLPWRAGANPSSSNGWAMVKNTPMRLYKHACHEGGLAVPLVVRWPQQDERFAGRINHASTHITDLYPTVLELASVDYPAADAAGSPARLTGVPLPKGERSSAGVSRPPIFEWYRFSAAWIDGDWKATRLYGGPWQLFNLRSDRGEADNLSEIEGGRLNRMVQDWRRVAKSLGDVPTPPPRDQQPGWGLHRLEMICPHLIGHQPPNSQVTESSDVAIRIEFDAPIDFSNTKGKSIRLYQTSDESKPIWSADPSRRHAAQGSRVIRFNDVPPLQPDTSYFVRWDGGWVKVGGDAVGPLNNGAYWWRFRTPRAGSTRGGERVKPRSGALEPNSGG